VTHVGRDLAAVTVDVPHARATPIASYVRLRRAWRRWLVVVSLEDRIMWDRHGPEDVGLVGTPYFWTGVAGSLVIWAALMVALWW
jgi:hypothetical protein